MNPNWSTKRPLVPTHEWLVTWHDRFRPDPTPDGWSARRGPLAVLSVLAAGRPPANAKIERN